MLPFSTPKVARLVSHLLLVGWLDRRLPFLFCFVFSFLRRVEGGDLSGEGQVQVLVQHCHCEIPGNLALFLPKSEAGDKAWCPQVVKGLARERSGPREALEVGVGTKMMG